MFAWELWKEWMESSMEMAAKTTLSSVAIDQGMNAQAEAYSPISHRNDPVFAEYKLFQKLANMTACFISQTGEAQFFSPNWQEQTGLSPYQCLREAFDQFFYPQHRDIFYGKLKDLLKECEHTGCYDDVSARFRAQYGSTHCGYTWYECILSPHQVNQDGTVIFALLMRDITREIETEYSLRTARIETELAMQGRTEFLSHMSHELRTPLNAIMGFAEMMERGIYGSIEHDAYRDYLTNIRESGNTLLHRINDMLEIASIEVKGAVVEESRVELESLLEIARKLHRHEAFCRKVTVKPPRTCPRLLLKCDQAKLARALGNIISNAVRFSAPEQQVEIECSISQERALCIAVIDKGEGFSPEHLATVNTMLHKTNGLFTGSSESVSMGLGLTVAREFIRLHAGNIDITSQKGEGTRVCITLPAERITSMELPRKTRSHYQQTAA